MILLDEMAGMSTPLIFSFCQAGWPQIQPHWCCWVLSLHWASTHGRITWGHTQTETLCSTCCQVYRRDSNLGLTTATSLVGREDVTCCQPQKMQRLWKTSCSFLSRMITLSITAWKLYHHIRLNTGFHPDLQWWSAFLVDWNGQQMLACISKVQPFAALLSDASGTWDCGAVCNDQCFQIKWLESWTSVHIMVKELLPIVVACAGGGGYGKVKQSEWGVTMQQLSPFFSQNGARMTWLCTSWGAVFISFWCSIPLPLIACHEINLLYSSNSRACDNVRYITGQILFSIQSLICAVAMSGRTRDLELDEPSSSSRIWPGPPTKRRSVLRKKMVENDSVLNTSVWPEVRRRLRPCVFYEVCCLFIV